MDNQQDQFGANTPANAGRSPQNPAATPTPGSNAASGAARKPAPTPNAQPTPAASAQNTANAGAGRQGEGQQTNSEEGTFLDTALQSGKQWIEDSGVLNSVNQLPQTLKDFGNRAVSRVNDLSTTQKVVGGAILAVGLGWLATRKSKPSGDDSRPDYGRQGSGSYGRRSYGYQAPDASTGRRPASGGYGRSDSGSPYGNSGSRYGSTGSTDASSRSESSTGFGASANTDHGARTSGGSYRSKNEGFGSPE